jgi:hypothetical protein
MFENVWEEIKETFGFGKQLSDAHTALLMKIDVTMALWKIQLDEADLSFRVRSRGYTWDSDEPDVLFKDSAHDGGVWRSSFRTNYQEALEICRTLVDIEHEISRRREEAENKAADFERMYQRIHEGDLDTPKAMVKNRR